MTRETLTPRGQKTRSRLLAAAKQALVDGDAVFDTATTFAISLATGSLMSDHLTLTAPFQLFLLWAPNTLFFRWNTPVVRRQTWWGHGGRAHARGEKFGFFPTCPL